MIYFRFECDTVALINRTAYILLKPYYFIRCGLTVGIYNNQRLLMPHGSVPFEAALLYKPCRRNLHASFHFIMRYSD